ncbi:RagB/SusD family nutrient uptake outer membrane protein [Hymenobacter sp. BT186]|uniref:RagB/SusD family nutrient uptake outer membrane protein n=1 Tax=Hymenobacter telluris TaxID=2816474 RepID=A0A939F0B5_9BACT|nr:RagB/SusD family nutrient uptake outer membrane protein [Hymenobacter telluris]MBO0359123.1 RagB/SusD family nutrient uptake outer membrane protein [Hymenobacter telluris]MBW3375149.1 RagB/SusD family nutrient uptake outer membrane protein [Hymenobacter norwichensis]
MKKIFLSLSLACALMTLGGCEKELEQTPISNGSVPDFYKTAADFDQAMSAVYGSLRGYPDREVILSELRSDNMFAVSSIGSRDWDPINNFSAALLTINPYVADAWASSYSTIFRANTMLAQLAENGAVTGSLRTRYEGEAKFIRAFMYLDLVRKFGKVPVIDQPLIPQEVAKIPRSEVSAVYALIESDLRTAIANLPISYTGTGVGLTSGVGRVTAGAAKSLLALMYLTKSGPTYGINGPGLNSNEYDKANVLLDEIIAGTGTARYALQSTYANIFSPTAENNSEVIFDLQYISNGTGNLGSSFMNVVVPDAYYTSIALPFSAGSVEIKPCSNDLNNVAYDTTRARLDIRRTVNIQQGYTFQNITDRRPFYKKYVNVAAKGSSRTDWATNFIVMRYADVLMMKAECEVRGVGGTAASAATRLTPLRTRAGQPALTTLTLQGLMDERRREFAGENLRWNDLMRSGLALTTMNAWAQREDQPAPNNKIVRPITADLLLLPVPQVELSSVPGLYEQNPGY